VPVGAFLSGGIDSSAIVAIMQTQSRRPVKTFSIGFSEPQFDEAPFAKAVAGHLGTQHTELYIHPNALLEAIPRLPAIYDEPLADTSHIPTVLLCEMARKQVTVCLSGDAGDELFGGYSLYQRAQQIWQVLRVIPEPQRQQMALMLGTAANTALEFQSGSSRGSRLLDRLVRFSELLPVPNDQALYQMLISPCRAPENWLNGSKPTSSSNGRQDQWQLLPGLLQRMMFWDFQQYLPDEILTKVDRAAMSVSLETRIPLLDHRIIEFAWSLPDGFRQKRGKGKWLLRQVLYQYVPRKLVDRSKQGFAAPIEEWLRSELRPWAEDLLSKSALSQAGLFNEPFVRQKWTEHLSRKRDWGRPLWNVLILQAWLDAHGQKEKLPINNYQLQVSRFAPEGQPTNDQRSRGGTNSPNSEAATEPDGHITRAA